MKKTFSLFLLLLLIIMLILPIFVFANSASPEFSKDIISHSVILYILALAIPYLLSIAGETLLAKWYLKVQGWEAVLVTNVFTTLVVVLIFPFAIFLPVLGAIIFAVITLIELFTYWMTYKKEVRLRKIVIYTFLANLLSTIIFIIFAIIYSLA